MDYGFAYNKTSPWPALVGEGLRQPFSIKDAVISRQGNIPGRLTRLCQSFLNLPEHYTYVDCVKHKA